MTFWDRIAGVYDMAQTFNGTAYRAMAEGVKRIVPKGAKVLDCAAGTGRLTIAAAEKAKYVLCTDSSAAMLEKARKNCRKAGLTNVRFARRDILDTGEPDDTYDIVMAGNVLHLLDDPRAAVRELYRVVKPGGKLILPTFLMNGGKLPAPVRLYKLFGFDPVRYYTGDEYLDMLKSCGCKQVKLTVIKAVLPVGFAVIKKIQH